MERKNARGKNCAPLIGKGLSENSDQQLLISLCQEYSRRAAMTAICYPGI